MKNLRLIKKGKDVLLALQKYGVVDQSTLFMLTQTIKNKRDFRRTLKRLCDRKLIIVRKECFGDWSKNFYQLNQNPKMLLVLANYLQCNIDDVKQLKYRYIDSFQESMGAALVFFLKQKFPKASVLKNIDLGENNVAQKVIPILGDSQQIRPDILMMIPIKNKDRPLCIAIDYDKSIKASFRISQKIKFYDQQTSIDAVIYLNSAARVKENIYEIIDSKVLNRCQRITKFKNQFIAFGLLDRKSEKTIDVLAGIDGYCYTLDQWIALAKDRLEGEVCVN